MKAQQEETLDVPLNDLVFDDKYQMRVDIPSVDHYVDLITSSEFWPFDRPLVVYRIRGKLKVVDGFTRGRAAVVAKLDKVPVVIMPGGHKEALQHAFGCNAEHGFRRTNADKNKAVLRAIAEYENTEVTPAQIALMCKVSRTYVYQLMKSLKGEETVSESADAQDFSELGECPVCKVNSWTETASGITCAACRHPHGEPVGGDQETIDPPPKGVLKKPKKGSKQPEKQPASQTPAKAETKTEAKPAGAVNRTKKLAEQASTTLGQLVRQLQELKILDEVREHVAAIQKVVNKRKRG